MVVKHLLLLMVVAAVAVSLALPVSGVTCSHGIGSPTRVINGETLKLRQGETLILNCKGDPVGTGEHFSMHDTYPGTWGVIWKNESSLNYTWYIEATDGPVHIFHFFSDSSHEMVFELTIRVYNLDLPTEMPTPGPYTTPNSEQISRDISHTEGVDPAKLHDTQRPSDTSTTGADNAKTAVTNAVERYMYGLYATVSVLVILILVIAVLCFVCIIKNCCRKGQRNKIGEVEQGQGRTVGGDNVYGSRQLPQSSETNSNDQEVHETSLDNVSISGQNDANTSTHHLTER